MIRIATDYLFSAIYPRIEDFTPVPGSAYYYCHSSEERSYAIDKIISLHSHSVQFVEIIELDKDTIKDAVDNTTYSLRSPKSILELLNKYSHAVKYFDVSGMDNRICAALLKTSLEPILLGGKDDIRIIYVEPAIYDTALYKSEGVFNDLSEAIEGIYPLPGFAKFFPHSIENTTLVALLGFEGGRFTHILENIQVPDDNVVPVIGVPGFRFEYPHIALAGNRLALESTQAWRKLKYASANSIVDVYQLLSRMLAEKPSNNIKLAPIGTKPHAVGAILFAIKHPKNVEIVYDNPKRNKKKTDGIGKMTECFASQLIQKI